MPLSTRGSVECRRLSASAQRDAMNQPHTPLAAPVAKAARAPAQGFDLPITAIVHQVERKRQNEELQHARNALEAEVARYTDLYDFAPVA